MLGKSVWVLLVAIWGFSSICQCQNLDKMHPETLPIPPQNTFCLELGFSQNPVGYRSFETIVNGTRRRAPRFTNLSIDDQNILKELEQDKTVQTLECIAFSQLKPRNCQEEQACLKNNEIKLALLQAAQTGRSQIQAKMECGTDEGDPVPHYLRVINGKINYIIDWTGDRFSGGGGVMNSKVDRLQLGYFVWDGEKLNFKPIKGKVPKEIFLVLKCQGQTVSYF